MGLGLPIILFVGGLVVLLWLFLWSRQRQRLGVIPETGAGSAFNDFPSILVSTGDAMLVATERGQLIHANDTLRRWLDLEGGIPGLEYVARLAQPAESFLELFSEEGQASFQLRDRWVQASSHRIPAGLETRMVIVLRELSGATQSQGHDLSKAILIVNEIGETVNASQGVVETLQTLLNIVRKSISADAGEITLWDEATQRLDPLGYVGDSAYVIALAEAGGVYTLRDGLTGYIAQQRTPILVADKYDDSAVRPKLMDSAFHSYIGVPLLLGERFIGTFELASTTPRRFSQIDLALLQAVSKPIAIAIYNAELYTAQAKRIEDLVSLQQIRMDEPPDAIYMAVNGQIARLLGAEMCGVLLYDERRQALVAQTPFYGIPTFAVQNYAILVPEGSEQRDIWERRDYWMSGDLTDEPLAAPMGLTVLVSAAGVTNTLLMPLQVGGRRTGMIQVANKRAPGGFTQRDVQNLRLLASQAAVVVEAVRLADAEQRRNTEMDNLQEITVSLGALAFNQEGDFLPMVNERIAQLMNVNICGIFIYDEAAQRLIAQPPFYGLASADVEAYSISLASDTPLAALWDQEDTWYTNYIPTSAVAISAGIDEVAARTGMVKTILGVLNAGGRRIGAIQAANKIDNSDFNERDARLLLIFAAQVAGMIENTRLFREAERRADEADRLRRVAELAGLILTPDDSFMPVLSEIAGMMQVPYAYVNTFDAQAGQLITEPGKIYGLELDRPVIADTYSPGFEYSVAVSRRPFMSNNIATDKRVLPAYRVATDRFGLFRVVVVPLVLGDQSLGELGVANRVGVFTEDDIRIVSAMAIHLAAALDRLRLYAATGQNLRRRLQELDAISRVSNELTITLDLDRVLDMIRVEAVSATEADGNTIALLAPITEWRAPDKPRLDRRLGERKSFRDELAPIELEALKRPEETVVIDDYYHTGGLLRSASLKPMPEDARSAIAAAITYEDQVVGILHLYSTQPRRFDPRAAAFLLTLAAKASLGYGNNRRFVENQGRSQGLRRRVDQLNQIFELGQMLQTTVDPVVMLEAIAYSVQQSCGFDVVVMMLMDERDDVLRRVAQAGLPINVFEESRANIMPRATLRQLLERDEYRNSESYFFPINDVAKWAIEHADTLSANFRGTRTLHPVEQGDWRDGDLLIVPLTGSNGELLGAMSLDRPFDGKRPDRSTIEILEIFAHQATATIENTRLYTASVRSGEQESRLNEVMEAISSTLDMTAIMEAVANGALRLLPFSRMTAAVLDSDQGTFDLMRVRVQPDQSLTVKREERASLDNTALGRTFEDGVDTLYTTEKLLPIRYDDLDAWRAEGEQVSLIVPFVTGGVVLGALHLGADDVNVYDAFEEYRALIKRIANLAAVAVQNTRLFNQAVNLRFFNESVVQSIQQGIIVLDGATRILTVNDYMRRTFGWDDSALRQELFTVHPAYRVVLAEPIRQIFKDGKPIELLDQRVLLTAPNRSNGTGENGTAPNALTQTGEMRLQNFFLYPLRAADSLRGVVLLIEDVTERERLERDLAARAGELMALMDISNRITSALRRDEVVALAMDEMARVIGYDTLSLWRREGDSVVLEAWRGYDPGEGEIRIPIQSNERLGWVIEDRKTASISQFEGRDPLPGESAAQSWLGMPLVRQDEIIGIITLSKAQPRYFTAASEQAALTFANQVAVGLANAALFEQSEANARRLSLLNRVSMRLAQSLDTENILEIALTEIANTLGGERARAYFFERDNRTGRVVVEYPRGEEPPTATIDLNDASAIRQVVRSAQPLLLADTASLSVDDPLYADIAPKSLSQYALIPMAVGGQVTGAFELEFYTPSDGSAAFAAFDTEKLNLALIIANQAAIAVMNANLLEQSLVRTRELETLLEAAQATSTILDLDDIFESVVGLTMHALDMDDCTLMMYDDVEDRLTVELNVNRLADDLSIPIGTGYNLLSFPAKMRAVRERQVMVIRNDDPESDARERANMEQHGDIVRMLVPLSASGETIGLLQVDLHEQARTITHREIRMAQALGAQAATKIENARLSTETAAQVEQGILINELSRALSSTMDIRTMIRTVREQVPSITEADDVYLALCDAPNQMINFPMAVHEGRDMTISPRAMGGTDEVNFVVRTRRPLSLGGENPSIDEVRRNLGIINGEGDIKRYLGVPIIAGDQIMGVLAVRDNHSVRPFGLNDQRILTTVGTQLGAAIQNAELFAQIRKSADELNTRVQDRTRELQAERDRLDALYRITSELGRSLDVEQVLNQALALMSQVINADEGLVLLIDQRTDQLYCRASLHYNMTNGSGSVVKRNALARAGDAEHPHHPSEMLGNWLVQTRNEILVNDLRTQPYWNAAQAGAEEWRGALGVVLRTGDDVQGVIVFLSRQPGIFGEAQLKLVAAASPQVATAVNNADLYTLIRDQAERMGGLLRTEREDAEKNSAILEGIADGVMLSDATGRVVLFNGAAERILELPRDQTMGQTLASLTQKYGASASWIEMLNSWVTTPRQRERGDLRVERLELGRRVVNVQASPVYTGEQFLGTVSVFRDITRDVEVDRMKSEFISNVSHELRTPMTSIKGYADLLMMGGAGDVSDQQKFFLNTIRNNAERLANLVDDLLDISKLDSGEEQLKLEPFSVGVLLEEVIRNLKGRAANERKHLDVHTTIDPALPPLVADRLKVSQILTNVIDNAFNYTYAGGKIDIRVRQQDNPDFVVIAVEDSGIGIPQDFLPRVWNRFERYEEHALVMDVAGTGLGLSIVKNLVEMHRGEVWVESEVNIGTTFYIALPLNGPFSVSPNGTMIVDIDDDATVPTRASE